MSEFPSPGKALWESTVYKLVRNEAYVFHIVDQCTIEEKLMVIRTSESHAMFCSICLVRHHKGWTVAHMQITS